MGSTLRVSCKRTLAVTVALLSLLLAAPAPAGAASLGNGTEHAFRTLGATVLAAIGGTVPNHAVDAIGNSLALLGARYRIESGEVAAAEASSANPQEAPAPPVDEVVADPSTLPPASAGSNGTTVPHTAAMSRDQIFAHTRGDGESTAILLTGVALAPPDAPEAVQGVINNANTIVGRPYIWGGGHGSWYSHGYDCSGSVSFALFGGGLIPRPLTSGELEGWGAPGPGRWITVYANAGHTFAEIAGLRWDTVGDEQGTGPRWHLAGTSTAGFVARHPPGL
jgi:cell wall-associated NlpC family hydrolase